MFGLFLFHLFRFAVFSGRLISCGGSNPGAILNSVAEMLKSTSAIRRSGVWRCSAKHLKVGETDEHAHTHTLTHTREREAAPFVVSDQRFLYQVRSIPPP